MSSSPQNQDVLIVELNEFNSDLLTAATTQYALPALSKVLNFSRSTYKTQDRYNSGYLEPWVQWVSIHAGTSATQHKIKHLGDIPDLQHEQCWETLSKHNVSTGVWGVMNGARRQADKALFFLPDPWTFSEQAHPPKLNALLDLPRYVAKNYQNLQKNILVKKASRLLYFILTSGMGLAIFQQTYKLLKNLRHFGKKHFVFISYFDYISTLLFIKHKKKYRPQCCFLFLNSLAHLQHHYWTKGPNTITPEILLGLQYIDAILALLFKHFPNDAMVVHNGLSQMNTNHEKPWVLYRQKDPLSFLHALALSPLKIEQHMTHDGHVFFANPEDCQKAASLLNAARLQENRLFHVETNSHDPCKLFYQLSFTDELKDKENIEFKVGEKSYPFFKFFDRIVVRTGRHIPLGTIYSSAMSFPDHIFNHNFNTYLFHRLLPDNFSLRENKEQEIFIENEIGELA